MSAWTAWCGDNSGVARTGSVNIFYLDDRWLDPHASRRPRPHVSL
jgi:hypothetical protein